MSINVNVNGNPISIRRGKMVTADPNFASKEFQKRRRIRLEQVRRQSKDIAENVRTKVRKEKNKQLSEIEKLGEKELKKWQARKLITLQQQYKDCLKDIGFGHAQATLEDDSEDLWVIEKESQEKVAKERGKEALQKLQEKILREKESKLESIERRKYNQEVENARSTMVVSLQKTKSPFKKKKKKVTTKADDGMESDLEPDYHVPLNTLRATTTSALDDEHTPRIIEAGIQTSPPDAIAPEINDDTGTSMMYPLDTRISDRIKRRKLKCVSCDVNEDFMDMKLETYNQNSLKIQSQESQTVQEDFTIKELLKYNNEKYNQTDSLQVNNGNYEQHSTSMQVELPSKPTLTLRTTDRTNVVGGSGNKVQYYDHKNRFVKQYEAPLSSVHRVSEGSIEVCPSIGSEAEFVDKVYKRDQEAQTRGKKAMNKVKVQRSYNELMAQLPKLRNRERVVSLSCTKPTIHMSDERLKEYEKRRQNRLENAYEKLFPQMQKVTIPPKTSDLDFNDSTNAKTKCNVGVWSFDRQVPCAARPMRPAGSKMLDQASNNFSSNEKEAITRSKDLKKMLQCLTEHRNRLAQELETIPKTSNLYKVLGDLSCVDEILETGNALDKDSIISAQQPSSDDPKYIVPGARGHPTIENYSESSKPIIAKKSKIKFNPALTMSPPKITEVNVPKPRQQTATTSAQTSESKLQGIIFDDEEYTSTENLHNSISKNQNDGVKLHSPIHFDTYLFTSKPKDPPKAQFSKPPVTRPPAGRPLSPGPFAGRPKSPPSRPPPSTRPPVARSASPRLPAGIPTSPKPPTVRPTSPKPSAARPQSSLPLSSRSPSPKSPAVNPPTAKPPSAGLQSLKPPGGKSQVSKESDTKPESAKSKKDKSGTSPTAKSSKTKNKARSKSTESKSSKEFPQSVSVQTVEDASTETAGGKVDKSVLTSSHSIDKPSKQTKCNCCTRLKEGCEIVIKICDESGKISLCPTVVNKSDVKHESNKETKPAPTPKPPTQDNETKATSWREFLNQTASSTSTSYCSPPDFKSPQFPCCNTCSPCCNSQSSDRKKSPMVKFSQKKPIKSMLGTNPQQRNAYTDSSKSRKSNKNEKPLRCHIKRLLNMSPGSVEELTVSTVSDISTPNNSVIEIESNNPEAQLKHIMKHFKLNESDVNRFLNTSTNTRSPCEKEPGTSCSKSVKSPVSPTPVSPTPPITTERCQCINEYASEKYPNVLMVYNRMAENCAQKIENLSSMIEQVRQEKLGMLGQHNAHSVPNQYPNFPPLRQQNQSPFSLEQEQLNQKLLEVNNTAYPNDLNKNTMQNGFSAATNSDLDLSSLEMMDRFRKLKEVETNQSTSPTYWPNGQQPFLSKPGEQNENYRSGFLRCPKPPPSQGITVAMGYNPNINTMPHELSAIPEVDSFVSNKSHLAGSLEKTQTPNKKKEVKGKKAAASAMLNSILHDFIKNSNSNNPESSNKLERKISSASTSLSDILSEIDSTIKILNIKHLNIESSSEVSMANKDTDTVSLLSHKSVGSESSVNDIDNIEVTLKNFGMGWAVTTLKKTQEALALTSSSSSSVDISFKQNNNSILNQKFDTHKTNESSSVLSSFLQGLVSDISPNPNSTSSGNKTSRKTSTPVRVRENNVIGNNNVQSNLLLSGESDISSIRTNSHNPTHNFTQFYSLNEMSSTQPKDID